MLDDLNELRTFERILALGSLSAAARDLGVTLAVVSKRLASLERRVGVRLIQRTTRSLSATEAGEELRAHAERVLDALATAEERLATGRDEPVGTLRVGAPVSFGRRHVAPVLGRLAALHSRLSVNLRLDDRVGNLIDDRLDAAVRIGVPQDSAMTMRRLAENRRILVAAPACLDRQGRPATPEDLCRLTALRYGASDEPWRVIGPDGQTVEIAPRTRLRCDSGDAVHDWAVAGHGVTLRSEVDVAEDLALGRLERVLPGFASAPMPIHVLFPSKRQMSVKLRLFIEALTEHLRKIGRQ
ncbi:MAG: LysR family transcriptional regulator [Methylorubrum populi]